MIKMQIGTWLLAMFSVSTVVRYDRITEEDGEALRRKYCSVPLGKWKLCITSNRKGSTTAATPQSCGTAEGSQRLTVAGERDSNSSFPVGSDKVESLLCYLPKRFGCVWGCFSFNPVLIYCKAIKCPKQSSDAISPPRASLLLGDSPLVHTVHAVGEVRTVPFTGGVLHWTAALQQADAFVN